MSSNEPAARPSPPDCTASQPVTEVVVPVKPARRSLLLWLIVVSGLFYVAAVVLAAWPGAPAWGAAVLAGLGAANNVMAVVIRLAAADVLTGIGWLDQKTVAGAAALRERTEGK